MAIKKVQYLASKESESLSWSSDAASGDRITGSAKDHYLVHCDKPQQIDNSIRNASMNGVAIPELGEFDVQPNPPAVYPEWIVSNKEISYREGSAAMYDVVVTWSKLQIPDTLPTVSVGGVKWSEIINKDRNGKAIVNSSEQPFQPPLTREYHDAEILVSFNKWEFNPNLVETLRGTVNSEAVQIPGLPWTFQPRQLKLDEARYSMIYNTWLGYWQIDLRFTARADKYITKVVDQGFYTKNPNEKPMLILDKFGEPIQSPQLLDGNGKLLSDIAAPVILEFEIELEGNFGPLINYMTGT